MIWATRPPHTKVDRSFGREDGAPAAVNGNKRRRVELDGLDDVMDRQRHWLSRGEKHAGAATWRPKVQNHVPTKRWLTNLDCQLRFTLNGVGLKHVCYDSQTSMWQCWRRYPYAVFAQDLGPDGVARQQDEAACLYYRRLS